MVAPVAEPRAPSTAPRLITESHGPGDWRRRSQPQAARVRRVKTSAAGVEAARTIEPLCMLWCIQGFLKDEWTHAFKVLHA
jgi:hypothetical protein